VRQAASLDETEHRPWPLPARPWLMGQTWENLLFAHWPVAAGEIRSLVPRSLQIDTYDGSAWLGITPFRIAGLRLRGTFPIPGISSFLELNVRTYVTRGGKPGIWFFSLDTESRLAVHAARRAYRLPYHEARMACDLRGGWRHYESARQDASPRPYVFSARYRPSDSPAAAPTGSIEHFLTERYCLYASGERGRLLRADIHHPPWPLQPAEATFELNTMPPEPLVLPGDGLLLHFAARQDVVIWPLEGA
jgi:uncharacterized protein